MFATFKKIYPIISLVIFCSLLWQDTAAQRIDKRTNKNEESDINLPFRTKLQKEQAELKETPLTIDSPIQPLEAAVDAATYIVGPGDIFQISIWSGIEATFKIPVNPEGELIIPTIGALAVDGKALSEVQKQIREAGNKKYLQTLITANLVSLRRFRVHVTGQVLKPGPYEALAVDRVSDLIEEAGGLTDWAAERSVEVRHLDGTVEIADLYQYKKLGNLAGNLSLKGGDVIYVPPIAFSKATIRVEGLVEEPGIYQLLENETLQDFLLRVEAFNKVADLKDAYIERKTAAGGTEIIPIFPYLQKQGNGHSELPLRDGDVLMVPSRKEEVYVIGAVNFPGPYPFYPNLRAIDYAGFAGSNEKAVKHTKIRVVRAGGKQTIRGLDTVVNPGDTVVIPERAKFGFQEATTLVFTLTNILVTLKAVGVIGN
jgi:protein involved in polysaccharide export with SLBB domain